MRYITLTSNRTNNLLDLLNDPAYKDYKVLAILPTGLEHIAYLEKEIKTPTEMGLVSPPVEEKKEEPILLKTRKKNEQQRIK